MAKKPLVGSCDISDFDFTPIIKNPVEKDAYNYMGIQDYSGDAQHLNSKRTELSLFTCNNSLPLRLIERYLFVSTFLSRTIPVDIISPSNSAAKKGEFVKKYTAEFWYSNNTGLCCTNSC